jgi:hypothetical protein
LFMICSRRNRAAMHADPDDVPVEIRLREAEVIALACHRAAQDDAWSALVAAIADAHAEPGEAEQRLASQDRLVSRRWARCWTGMSGLVVPPPPGAAVASKRPRDSRP